jgi:hypothetical protein
MSITKMISALLLATACLAVSGCSAPTRMLVSQDFVGERSVQYLMQKTVTIGSAKSKNKTQLYNFFTRICSVSQEGKQEDCVDTLILENVQSKPIY